jgi:hypothetical protein
MGTLTLEHVVFLSDGTTLTIPEHVDAYNVDQCLTGTGPGMSQPVTQPEAPRQAVSRRIGTALDDHWACARGLKG